MSQCASLPCIYTSQTCFLACHRNCLVYLVKHLPNLLYCGVLVDIVYDLYWRQESWSVQCLTGVSPKPFLHGCVHSCSSESSQSCQGDKCAWEVVQGCTRKATTLHGKHELPAGSREPRELQGDHWLQHCSPKTTLKDLAFTSDVLPVFFYIYIIVNEQD